MRDFHGRPGDTAHPSTGSSRFAKFKLMNDCVILRDAAASRWLRFRDPRETVQTTRLDEVAECLRRVEALVNRHGLYAAGFVSYEAAPAFDRALEVCTAQPSRFPLVWFGLYDAPEEFALPRPVERSDDAAHWTPNVAEHEYAAAIAELKRCIAAGETYQANTPFACEPRWPATLGRFSCALSRPSSRSTAPTSICPDSRSVPRRRSCSSGSRRGDREPADERDGSARFDLRRRQGAGRRGWPPRRRIGPKTP